MAEVLNKKVLTSLKPNQHPYLNGAWQPNVDEYTATDMEVIGEIPKDIDGVYVRNTENPVLEPLGHYHPFDGDGMLHSISFKEGIAEYRNRFVRTKGFEAEQLAGEALWAGIANNPALSKRPAGARKGTLKILPAPTW